MKTSKCITKKQAREDFEYLEGNIDLYLVDDDYLVNVATPKLRNGEMSIKDFIIWSIHDIFYFVTYDYYSTPLDKEFLKTDERALEIKERYGI